jgi:hypothetical protein
MRARLTFAVLLVFLFIPAIAVAAPTARYTYSPPDPYTGVAVTFDGTGSTCDRPPCSYRWTDDRDDGPDPPNTLLASLGSNGCLTDSCDRARVTFTNPGVKNVRLRVLDAADDRDSTVQAITVRGETRPDPEPTPGPDPLGGEPAPIGGQGYTQTFGDEFSTLNRAVWDDHIWYQGPAQPGAQSVSNGVLHLRSFESQGFRPTTITTMTSRKLFTSGYFEARIRWTQGGHGTWPAFWLFSDRHARNPVWPAINPYCANNGLPAAKCWAAEIDIMDEGDTTTSEFSYHILGVHKNTSDGYGVQDEIRPYPNWFLQPNLSTDWHTYSAAWTATQVRFYIDERLIATAPVFESTGQPLFLLLQNWTGSGCWKCGAPTADTDVLVDWVRVWQD